MSHSLTHSLSPLHPPPQPFRLVSEKAAWSVGHLRVIFRDAKDVKGFVDNQAKNGKKKKKK